MVPTSLLLSKERYIENFYNTNLKYYEKIEVILKHMYLLSCAGLYTLSLLL